MHLGGLDRSGEGRASYTACFVVVVAEYHLVILMV
jgi:hypothetical protein